MLRRVSRAASAGIAGLTLLAGCMAPGPPPPLPPPTPLPEVPAWRPGEPITAAAWQEATVALFLRLDADGDGLVTLEEITAGIDLLDADGDGWITSREARGLLVEDVLPYRLLKEDLARLACACFTADLDGDGAISALEFSVSRLRELVHHDLDRSGVLEPEEMEQGVDFTRVRF